MPSGPVDKVKGMIGLAAKSANVTSGVEGCESAIRKGKAFLALIDAGASEQTKKSVRDACSHRGVTLRELPEGELENAIGKPGRMAAAITHDGFASGIIRLMDQQRDCGGACRE